MLIERLGIEWQSRSGLALLGEPLRNHLRRIRQWRRAAVLHLRRSAMGPMSPPKTRQCDGDRCSSSQQEFPC